MFLRKGWIIHVETDVNSFVRTLIERYDGSKKMPRVSCLLVDVNFVFRNNSDEKLLLAHWMLAACHLKWLRRRQETIPRCV
jgi:hypothetical protein